MESSDDSNNLSDTTFVSWINKTTFQEPKLTNKSSFNLRSNLAQERVLEANNEIFKESSFDHILNSAQELIKKTNSSQSKKTKFHLLSNGFDPVAIFEKSLPKCQKCSSNENYTHSENTNSLNTKYIHSENSSQESKSEDDVRPIVPKFVAKAKKNMLINKKMPIASSSGIENEKNIVTYQKTSRDYELDANEKSGNMDVDMTDEDKAHKSQVAKITFKSAREHLLASNPAARRTLGASHKAQAKFVSPMLSVQEKQEVTKPSEAVTDDRLKHIDPKMIEIIESEILDKGSPIGWDDIAGLQHAKNVIQEAVVWPLLRPDIFTGLRRPPRGVLLFGPPGTGKTLIGKCVAAQCHATFFSISASSLTSKWIGDGEKMVRALFAVARCHQPAVIFIDEIDSLLSQRSDTEHEASRRIKTEFLVQFDGAATGEEDRLLIVGATNRPHELDEAARRRLVKRLYIPLPDLDARRQIISNLLKTENHDLSTCDMADIASMTDGYSGADMKCLCSEAAMGPIRSVPLSQIVTIDRNKVRSVNIQDFKTALLRVRPSVSQDDLGQYVKWNNTYGQGF